MAAESNSLPIVVIAGRPNVGKSSLFNRILGRRAAIVNEQSGTTRDRHYKEADWNGRHFTLVDTGGMADKDNSMGASIAEQAEAAVREADLVLFLVDAEVGATDQDLAIAKKLRNSGTKLILVANKVDNENRTEFLNEFRRLGLGEPLMVSALQGKYTGDLLDAVVDALPSEHTENAKSDGKTAIKLAIVGRPNVGKSTLVNRIAGEQRVIACDTPGTTRDSVDTAVEINGVSFILVDTAGLRKRARVSDEIEIQAGQHTERSLERCDIALLLLDGTASLDEQDLRILHVAREKGKGLIVGINKWDSVAKDGKTFDVVVSEMRSNYIELEHIPIISLSALTGQRANKVIDIAIDISNRMNKNLAPQDIKEWLDESVAAYHHPVVNEKFMAFYSAAQVSNRPPILELKVNQPTKVRDSYTRYLLNRFMEKFDMEGVPIQIRYAKKRRP